VGQFWVHRWEELRHSHLFRASPTNRVGWIFEMRRWVGGWVWVGGFPAAPMGGWFLGAPMGESHRYRGVGDRACGGRNFEVDSKKSRLIILPPKPS
jgi:hypothetical protein